MEYALYPGCLAQTEQYACEISVRRVLPEFGVKLLDLDGFSCCGDPLRSVSDALAIYLAARNLAIVASEGLSVLCICNSCYLSLVEARKKLEEGAALRERVSKLLSLEGLEYRSPPDVVHVVGLLHDTVGLEELAGRVQKPLEGVKVAAQVGCHVLRPSDLLKFDDPERPAKVGAVIRALGAKPAHYPGELECCGAGLLALKPDAALAYAALKLKSVATSGAEALVTPCPGCFKMLDGKQRAALASAGGGEEVPTLYLTQLVGLALGISPEELGLELNQSPVERLLRRL